MFCFMYIIIEKWCSAMYATLVKRFTLKRKQKTLIREYKTITFIILTLTNSIDFTLGKPYFMDN